MRRPEMMEGGLDLIRARTEVCGCRDRTTGLSCITVQQCGSWHLSSEQNRDASPLVHVAHIQFNKCGSVYVAPSRVSLTEAEGPYRRDTIPL